MEERAFLPAFAKLSSELKAAKLSRFEGAYREATRAIRGMLTVVGHTRPTESRPAQPFIQHGMPEVRRDKLSEGTILTKSEFAKAACARASPFKLADEAAAGALDEDLRAAIDFIVENGERVPALRDERIAKLRSIALTLEPMRTALDACKCEAAKSIAKPFNAAWTAAVIDAMEWPDVDLPVRYIKGFDVVFDVPDSGVFRAELQPAEITPEKFESDNTRMVASISKDVEKAAMSTDPEQAERREACWKRTKEEIKEGLVGPPRSRAYMDKKYKRGKWRCLGRSAIKQKGKWRCIDNGKRSKHNRGTTMRERITCGRADFPISMAREFLRRSMARRAAGARSGIHKKRLRMRHGTDDLRAAYRHVPTRQMRYTNVAVWDDDRKRVAYCEVPGHNFGLKSAVVNFNRFPELAAVFARRILWVVTEHYYDDNSTAEPSCTGSSGQSALTLLCASTFFGFPFDPNKHEEMKGSNEYLGVLSDISDADEGVLRVDVSAKRRRKIKELIKDIKKRKKLSSGSAGSLFGKARCLLSPAFSSVGKACLQPIKAREYQRRQHEIDPEIADSLDFIELVCDDMPPTTLQAMPSERKPVVIFTDAEGSQRDGDRAPSGHLGFVVYHPKFGKRYAHAKAPAEWVELFDAIKQRKTYIGQYELAAAITPFLSLPRKWFEGYPVELWVDNSGAVGALIKGYSGVPDCAKLVNCFHFTVARLGITSLWIDYVPSESNPADVPSRVHETSIEQAELELSELGLSPAIHLSEMHLPEIADSQGNWLPVADMAASMWS